MNRIQKAIGSITLAALAGCSFNEAVVNVGSKYKSPLDGGKEVFIIQGFPAQPGFNYTIIQPASQPGIIFVPQLSQPASQPAQGPDKSYEGIKFEDKDRKYNIRADCEQ